MKILSAKRNRPRTRKRRQGFTLTEVLVTMGVLSLLIPPVLLVGLHLTKQAAEGVEHDTAISKARIIQQHFITLVNSSDSFQLRDSGNILQLSVYNPDTDAWEDNTLTFIPSDNALKLFKPGTGGSLYAAKTFSDQAYTHGSNAVFSTVGTNLNLVRIQLVINDSPLTTDGTGNTGAIVDVTSGPRNAGRLQ